MHEEYEEEVTPSVNPDRFRRLLELALQAVAEERGCVTAERGSLAGLNVLMPDYPNKLNDPVLTFLGAIDQHFDDDDPAFHTFCARFTALAEISRNRAFRPWWTNQSPAERQRLYIASTHAASITPLDGRFEPREFFAAFTRALVDGEHDEAR